MQATRILPDLQASLLCEDVRQETSGNFILVGVIGFVNVPQLPVVAFKLCVFNRWAAGIGNFTESVRLIAPDQTTVLRDSKVKFALQDPTHNATNVTVFGQVKFEAVGAYYILKLRFPIPVRVVTPPQGAPAQQRPPTETR
jgi:hypothetical protein